MRVAKKKCQMLFACKHCNLSYFENLTGAWSLTNHVKKLHKINKNCKDKFQHCTKVYCLDCNVFFTPYFLHNLKSHF